MGSRDLVVYADKVGGRSLVNNIFIVPFKKKPHNPYRTQIIGYRKVENLRGGKRKHAGKHIPISKLELKVDKRAIKRREWVVGQLNGITNIDSATAVAAVPRRHSARAVR